MAHARRNIVLGLIGAGVVGGLLFLTFRPEPIPVDLHTVETGKFEITVDVDGTTRVAEIFEVSTPISGMAMRSPVRVGDPVVAGETVVSRVEPSAPGLLDARTRLQAEAAVREAEATLSVAQTGLAEALEVHSYARLKFERTNTLAKRGVVSASRLEDIQQQLAVTEAALEAERARIDQAKSGLQRARAALVEAEPGNGAEVCCVPIVAPADGVVLEIDHVSARPVTAGQRLLTIGDAAQIELVADLLSSDAVRLPDNARARVERWGGEPLEARLSRIEPAGRTKVSALGIEEQRVDAVFDLLAPPETREQLGHGFAAYLRVVIHEEENAVLVPLSATFRVDDDWAVFKADGDRVSRVPIELGRRNARFAVAISGLSPGDRVVEHPREDLTDGALIVPRTAL
ncbi:RND transporter [Notoacmeibacter marinus]|uniref:RND transporter n=1 Tax=Notoacmeibacter marinus TaxID=1876515 RepID=A0A231V1R1_9HYPH|nr:HlyD family efflux transporter periplasmic adaptor subunit [Notoacmeibacter marinus]OXT02118.1 RND transporter [Notoacmeibacter marinus]